MRNLGKQLEEELQRGLGGTKRTPSPRKTWFFYYFVRVNKVLTVKPPDAVSATRMHLTNVKIHLCQWRFSDTSAHQPIWTWLTIARIYFSSNASQNQMLELSTHRARQELPFTLQKTVQGYLFYKLWMSAMLCLVGWKSLELSRECTKKQETKPFQACSRCKEVICCSKACQVASWPHHKTAWNFNAKNKEALPNMIRPPLTLSPSPRNGSVTYSVVSQDLTKWRLTLAWLPCSCSPSCGDVKLKADHEKLPPSQEYDPVNGCTFTMAETLEMIGPRGGVTILESAKSNSEFMEAKGSLGVAIPAAAKVAQQTDDWGANWVEGLRRATSQ
ncbi:hypothetical protein LshimejAT787_0401270 [Lyophyllum shimeji]|uniref:MYND-type domain-containing protein n=1 Tax=Lyophyllum shimeji TaxID=47721 RepID=A0A9P3UN81_LYOSH|nr:hypothetical protein LshimejAT787_0401270 [Lyophyllum shimeji]